MNWRQWLNAHGVGAVEAPRRLTINSYPLLIERRGAGSAWRWDGGGSSMTILMPGSW